MLVIHNVVLILEQLAMHNDVIYLAQMHNDVIYLEHMHNIVIYLEHMHNVYFVKKKLLNIYLLSKLVNLMSKVTLHIYFIIYICTLKTLCNYAT